MKYFVIVPAFNAQDSILRCLVSVAEARRDHAVGLLVIDDGSSDNTRRIAEQFSEQHPWAFVLSQANRGEAAARNEGLSNARGRYICFVDADDTISDRYFDFLDERIASTGADVLIFGVNRIALNGSCISRPNIRADLNYSDVARMQLQVTRNRNLYWYSCARTFSFEAAKGLRFSEEVKMGPDVIFNIALLNKVSRVAVFPDCLYNYYENPSSITSAKFKPALLESIEAHYRARIEAHIWPEVVADRQLLLGDFARSYIEHMLPYLLNNLQYLPRNEREWELRRVRDSFVYKECIPNYTSRHPSTTMRWIIYLFIKRKLSFALLVLYASQGAEVIRRMARKVLRNIEEAPVP